MSESNCCSPRTRAMAASFVGVMGSFLLIGALAWLVVGQKPPAVDAARAELRKTTREKLDREAAAELVKFAVDPNKENLARLSIDRAIEVVVAEWGEGSEAGRAKLLERLEASKVTPSFE
jgi:hypothetical protein